MPRFHGSSIPAYRSRLRPLPPFILLAALGAQAALHRWLPGAAWLGFPWTLAGLGPLLGGLVLGGSAAGRFRRRGTPIRPGRPSTALVTDGPYRFTRNPMYLGMSLVLIGVAILMGTLTPLSVPPLFVVVIQVLFVEWEQRLLDERFGEEYRHYRARVRAWV